jgi:hypothetical protein
VHATKFQECTNLGCSNSYKLFPSTRFFIYSEKYSYPPVFLLTKVGNIFLGQFCFCYVLTSGYSKCVRFFLLLLLSQVFNLLWYDMCSYFCHNIDVLFVSYLILSVLYLKSCFIDKAVSRRLLTAQARVCAGVVRTKVIKWHWDRFSLSSSVFFCEYNTTGAAYSFTCHHRVGQWSCLWSQLHTDIVSLLCNNNSNNLTEVATYWAARRRGGGQKCSWN